MKKLSKLLLATITGLVLLLSCVFGVGCKTDNSGAEITFNEYNAIVKSAATDFYSSHTKYETFEAITYRWTEHEVNKENVTLEYKENATDEEMVSDTFLNQTGTDATYTVAVKKGNGKLIGQLTVNRTTTENFYEIKEDDTLDHVVSSTVESKTYRLVNVTGDEPAYYLIYESSSKTDDEDAVVEKKYTGLTQEDYDDYMDGYMVKYPNQQTGSSFFGLSEIFMVYSSLMTVEKKDNKISISFGYNFSDIDIGNADFTIGNISISSKIVFENGKISKAEASTAQSDKTTEFEKTVVLDFVNSAAVDVSVNLTDFTEDTSWSFTNGFTDAISDLPSASMFS